MNDLATLSAVRRALAKATSIDQVLRIRDQAEAVRALAEKHGGMFDVQQDMAEGKVRAEREIGARLPPLIQRGGDRKSKSHNATLRISDLGLSKSDSSRWQALAGLAEKLFESKLVELREAHQDITSAAMYRLARVTGRNRRNAEASKPETGVVASVAELVEVGKTFATIYADPPWKYGNQGTRAATDEHYSTLTVPELCALPVASLAAERAHLHLWTTNAFLFDAKLVMEAWGFEYKSCFVWVKKQIGIGNYWRVSHEFMLLGVRGSLTFADKSLSSWLLTKRGKHSAKPEEVRHLIERASPAPRLELFGRRTAKGWVVLGNQIEKGDQRLMEGTA